MPNGATAKMVSRNAWFSPARLRDVLSFGDGIRREHRDERTRAEQTR